MKFVTCTFLAVAALAALGAAAPTGKKEKEEIKELCRSGLCSSTQQVNTSGKSPTFWSTLRICATTRRSTLSMAFTTGRVTLRETLNIRKALGSGCGVIMVKMVKIVKYKH
jgi:hypothetical protein